MLLKVMPKTDAVVVVESSHQSDSEATVKSQ